VEIYPISNAIIAWVKTSAEEPFAMKRGFYSGGCHNL